MSKARQPTSAPSESVSMRAGPSTRTPLTSWGARISAPKRRACATARVPHTGAARLHFLLIGGPLIIGQHSLYLHGHALNVRARTCPPSASFT